MVYFIVLMIVSLILIFFMCWFVYKIGKELGEVEGILKVVEEEKKEYEKDKEIINNNNNLTRDELLDKLHNIQKKDK